MSICAVALALLLDTSLSMTTQDFRMQIEGTAAAFEDSAITQIIANAQGGIAVSVFTFEASTQLEIPWVVVRNQQDANELARRIRGIEHSYGADTRIAPAITAASSYMAQAPCEPDEMVIDISTDGETWPDPIVRARDAAQEQGIKINAIGVSDRRTDLYEFLTQNVRTNNGFVIVVETWERFVTAIRRKISLEIASR
jgi:Ca-activated chloride channel family protein